MQQRSTLSDQTNQLEKCMKMVAGGSCLGEFFNPLQIRKNEAQGS